MLVGSGPVHTARDYLPDAQALVDAGSLPQSGGPPLSFMHLPVPSVGGGVAPDTDVRKLVLTLTSAMKAGEVLYLHCDSGDGRSGAIAAVLLGAVLGLASSEALRLVQRARDDRPGAAGRAPETHEQSSQVHRLLADGELCASARMAPARAPDSAAADAASLLASTLVKVRAVLARRGEASLIFLRRYAAARLWPGATSASRAQFDRLCAEAEWYLTSAEAEVLWRAAGGAPGGGGGTVPVDGIWAAVIGRMSPARAAAVHAVFARLARGAGALSLSALADAFNAHAHPDVASGRRLPADVEADFCDAFGLDAAAAAGARHVTAGEFEAYYAAVSPAVPDDAAFEAALFGAWMPPGASPAPPGGNGAGPNAAAVLEAADARHSVSRTDARAALRRNEVTGKITASAPPIAMAGADGAAHAASALERAFLEDLRERASGQAPQLAARYGGGGGSGAPRLAVTPHGMPYCNLSDPATAIAALRALLRRSSPAGAFALAAVGGALRQMDDGRAGTAAAAQLSAACAAAGAPLAPDDTAAAFRAIAATVLDVPAASLDAARARLPLEAMHATLRAPLAGSRLDTVARLFEGFDARAAGAVPVGVFAAAFNAHAYPPVAAGRLFAAPVFAAFQAGFVDAFTLVDARGPAAKREALAVAEGLAAPAYTAYGALGHGDGLVRFPFFRAFHEAVSALLPDDAEFTLVVSHVWAGAGGRRIGGGAGASAASSAPVTVVAAARAEDSEVGMLASMQRMAERDRRGVGHTGSLEIGTRAPRPPSHAQAAGGSGTAVNSGLGGSAAAAAIYAGGDGRTGSSSTGLRSTPHYTVGHGAAAAQECTPWIASSGDAAADAALAAARAHVLRRGARALFALLADIASYAAGGALPPPSEPLLLPPAAFLDALRGLTISDDEARAILCAVQARPPGSAADARRFITLLRGDLGQTRAETVELAFAHLCELQAAAGFPPPPVPPTARAHNNAPLPPPPAPSTLTLDTLRFAYRSAAHPEVLAGRRAEEEVLRELYETFAGPPFTAADGATVTAAGFAEYYANLSLFVANDTHFCKVLYDCWGLARASRAATGLAGAAGRPTAATLPLKPLAPHGASAYAPPPARGGGGKSSIFAALDEHSDSAFSSQLAAVDGNRRALPPPASEPETITWKRGHGLERAGYGYHR